ncbi:MAG: isoprenylcysteine carboxylmethyltransferase family protein [Candidatus Nanohalobium sp.]
MSEDFLGINKRSFLFGAVAGLFTAFIPSFLDHVVFFLSGQIRSATSQGHWGIVAVSVIAFLAFLIPLKYRRRADWRSMGIYTAFIVSLFVEMYGIPLTIYLSSAVFGSVAVQPPQTVLTFHLLGKVFGVNIWMLTGLAVTAIGAATVAVGWATIYRTDKDLVTSGIYSYSRHPQYLGIILVAFGWFIGWPTILTALMLPVLTYEYVRLCRKEEKEVMEEVGEQKYKEYMKSTHMLI